MAPEQAEGKPADHRADIFSLGVILYELATGERPFKGDTPLSALSSLIRDTPPSVIALNPAIPRELAQIIKRCLTKDKERRYQSAKDVRNELEDLKQELQSGELSASGATAPMPSVAASRLGRLTLAVALIALAALSVLVVKWRSRAIEAPASTGEKIAGFKQLTSQPEIKNFPRCRLTGNGSFTPAMRRGMLTSTSRGRAHIYHSDKRFTC
jgi:serine/threonine protein kinase